MSAPADAWKGEALVRTYLEGIRGAIPLAREQIDLMLRLIEGAALSVERIADLGCGSGVLARAILDAYPRASATLVDFSEPMLREARTQMQPYAGRCIIAQADLSDPAWAHVLGSEATFDVIVSGYAIHHLTDVRKRALYQEIFDRLRPGGVFINIDHVASPSGWLEENFDELLIDSFHAYQQAAGLAKTREEVAAEYVHREDKQGNLHAPVEDQCNWLRACGFQDVDCYFKVLELAVFGGRAPKCGGYPKRRATAQSRLPSP